jgi:hypothetical protein
MPLTDAERKFLLRQARETLLEIEARSKARRRRLDEIEL